MLPRAAVLMKSPLRELSVALVGEREMTRLHREFMKIDSSTDVMTFELERDRRGRAIAGEIVVCIPVAQRQARIQRTRAADEVLLYAVHGMLHLSGLDDRTAADFQARHRKEDDILSRLGVGAVFAPAKRGR